MTGKRHDGTFWRDRNRIDLDDGYKGTYLQKENHQEVQLRLRLFTLCKFHLKINNFLRRGEREREIDS